MNRIVVFGIAILFAVIGIALMGGDSVAEAGQRCGGCGGCYADACDSCACGGRQGLFAPSASPPLLPSGMLRPGRLLLPAALL